ncbi:MAG: hypothetical protein ACREXY_08750, partial [Gammaproteobacteria bacterium]
LGLQLPWFSQALAGCTSPYVVCLEAGVVVQSPEWLAQLLLYTQFESVCVVAPIIVAADGSIEEAGRLLSKEGALPAMRGWDRALDGHAGSLSCAREVAAVSGICALASRETLDRLGGLSASYATLRYAWIDFSLKALEHGLSCIVTPQTMVRRAVGQPVEPVHQYGLDRHILQELWRDRLRAGDPYHNPDFSTSDGGYQARPTSERVL